MNTSPNIISINISSYTVCIVTTYLYCGNILLYWGILYSVFTCIDQLQPFSTDEGSDRQSVTTQLSLCQCQSCTFPRPGVKKYHHKQQLSEKEGRPPSQQILVCIGNTITALITTKVAFSQRC